MRHQATSAARRRAMPGTVATAWLVLGLGLLGCSGRLEGVVLSTGGSEGDGGPATPCFSAVAAGRGATCVIRASGALECYGGNEDGQLGVQTSATTWQHVEVSLGGPAVQVAAGQGYACARRLDNTLWCWGLAGGARGQLGNGSTAGSATPVQVTPLGSQVVDVAAGDSATCARTSDSAVWCWGDNTEGAVGIGTLSDIEPPTRIAAVGPAQAICTNGGHTCALATDGVIWCWGRNSDGETGTVTSAGPPVPTPTRVLYSDPTLSAASWLACGAAHTCAVLRRGPLACWGRNQDGQLGLGLGTPSSAIPVPVPALGTTAGRATAGLAHTCVLTTGGDVKCFGSNEKGTMANDTFSSPSFDPVVIGGLPSAVTSVSAGAQHNCVLTTDGNVWCWGDNEHGEIVGGVQADQPSVVVTPLQLDCETIPSLPQ